MKSTVLALATAALVASPVVAQMPTGTMDALRPDQQQFFELYKDLVETDTTVTNGSCKNQKWCQGQFLQRCKDGVRDNFLRG